MEKRILRGGYKPTGAGVTVTLDLVDGSTQSRDYERVPVSDRDLMRIVRELDDPTAIWGRLDELALH